MTTSFMARHGARLIDNGYRILPIVPGHKKPGRYSAGDWRDYADWARHCDRDNGPVEAEIWAKWPDAGIGIAAGTVVAVDIDIRDADLALQLEKLAREMLGDTPLMRVGLPPKRLLVYRADQPFAGIKAHPLEILARGQQFVGYGVHPVTQRPYEWPIDNPVDTARDDIPAVTEAQCRGWLEAALKLVPEDLRSVPLAQGTSEEGWRGPSDPKGTLAAIQEALTYLPNDDLQWDDWFRVGMALKGALGNDGWEIFSAWSSQSAKHDPVATAKLWRGLKPHSVGAGTIYWLAECQGWTPSAEVILNGNVEEAMRGVAIDLPKDNDLPDDEPEVEEVGAVEEAEPVAPQPVEAPADSIADLLQVEGVLAEFIDWCGATAYRQQPWLALGAGLALVGTLAGRRYRNYRNNRPNVYVIGIADSGGGKENARTRIKELLFSAGLDRYLGGDEIASGKALLAALGKHPARLFQPDEFGQSLKDMLGPKAPAHLREIWTNLTKLYTSAGSVYLGTEYADQTNRPRVDLFQPHACLHATTVPGPFWAALQSGAMSDGSLARFLIFLSPNDYPDAPDEDLDLPDPPASLIAACQEIARGPTHHDFGPLDDPNQLIAGISINPYTVPFTDEARALTKALADEQTADLRRHAGTRRTAAIARNLETAQRVALIRAISRDPQYPVVTEDDLTWAWRLTLFCAATTQREAEAHVADNEVEAQHKRALDIIRKAGPVGITKKAFYKATHWLGDNRRRESVIAALVEAGEIEVIKLAGKTKPTAFYRIRDSLSAPD